MKKNFKVILNLLLVIIIAAGGVAIYVKAALPYVGAVPNLKVELLANVLHVVNILPTMLLYVWLAR